MTRLPVDRAVPASSSVTDRGRVRRVAVRRYVFALAAAASAAVVGLLATGAAPPPFGACLLLVIPLTVCVNRFVSFPDELGLTGEAAVLFTAIIAFRSESPLLGPALLGLLVGVLDGRQWERRAFLRMSYNSGSQTLIVLAAATAFGVATRVTGASSSGLLVAAVASAVVALVVDTACSVTLVALLGEPPSRSVGHHLFANVLVAPLALVGAAMAIAVDATGAWLVVLLLVPTAFVPELVYAALRRPRVRRRAMVVVLGAVGATALVVDAVLRDPHLGVVLAAVLVALLVAIDAQPPVRRAVFSGSAVVLGVTAGLASTPPAWIACAAVGAAVVLSRRPVSMSHWLWEVPLVVAGIAVGAAARLIGPPVGVVTFVAFATLIVVVATWGSLPWSSRMLGPWGAECRRWWPLVGVVSIAGASLVGSVWAVVDGTSLALAFAEVPAAAMLACASAAARQWRFAPVSRRRAALQLAAGLAALGSALVAGALGEPVLAATSCAGAVALAAVVVCGCARVNVRARARI